MSKTKPQHPHHVKVSPRGPVREGSDRKKRKKTQKEKKEKQEKPQYKKRNVKEAAVIREEPGGTAIGDDSNQS